MSDEAERIRQTFRAGAAVPAELRRRFTREAPFLVTRKEQLHFDRVRLHLLLPDGRRHAIVIPDLHDNDRDVSEIARALIERRRYVKGQKIGVPYFKTLPSPWPQP